MSSAATDMDKARGRVCAIRGPVLDVEFAAGLPPPVNDALRIEAPTGPLIAEVQSHVDARTVRTVALQTTNGLARGVEAEATGAAIMVPVGDDGRVLPQLPAHGPACALLFPGFAEFQEAFFFGHRPSAVRGARQWRLSCW